MGVTESAYAVEGIGTIFKSDCEKCCCATRYYRISQSTRRDQWTTFALGALHAHNRLRQKHGSPPISLNMRMCKMAASQARYLADSELFEHSDKEERRHADGYCGENLAESIVWHDDYKRPSGEEVTLMWYNEGTDYNYEAAQFDPDAAQFTQIVWKKTRMFGIGFAEYEPSDSMGFVKTVVVANYFPCGNVQGKFKDNVLEPSDNSTSGVSDKQSKIQRKINQYQKKKERLARKPEILGGGKKRYGPGNLGFSSSIV